ncbi:MAG: RNase H family protein [Planctomycetota bacterium]
MQAAWDRYLLFTEAQRGGAQGPGWRFLLHAVDSERTVSASDTEPGMRGDRLALMAVVRGLEAIGRPAAVKLMTGSGYVRRGVTRGIDEWRAAGWKWERFGQQVPVRDADLWRRVDRALAFHRVSCRGWRGGDGHRDAATTGAPAGDSRQQVAAYAQAGADVAVSRVADRVINEPALLIVRGRRRRASIVRRDASQADTLLAAG